MGNDNDPCEHDLTTREGRLKKWGDIYSKAMMVIGKNLGVDKDHIYGACQAIQTASREMQIIERVMSTLGEGEAIKSTDVIGWGKIPKEETANA